MSILETLGALFVHDVCNDIVKAKEDAKHDAEALKTDQRVAYYTYAPRCRESETKILNDFNDILAKTAPSGKDIHEQKELYLMLLEALPYLVAIDGGGDIYDSSKRFISEKPETSYSFSGQQIRNLFAQKNSPTWQKYESIISLDRMEGTLWRDMLSLKVKENSQTIQTLVTTLFNDIIECIDNIAHLDGEWYRYSVSDITSDGMRFSFNMLIQESMDLDLRADTNNESKAAEPIMSSEQIQAGKNCISRMTGILQSVFNGSSEEDNKNMMQFYITSLLKYIIDRLGFSIDDSITVLDDCIGIYLENSQFQAKLIYEPVAGLQEFSEMFDTFPTQLPVIVINGAIEKNSMYIGMNFLPDATNFMKINEQYIQVKYHKSAAGGIADRYFAEITDMIKKEAESIS